MGRKIPSAIQELTLNSATYSNNTINPTFINFFFGKNGTGKSTIGRAIEANEGLTWKDGINHHNYSVLVYNKDFIDANIKSHENLPGVFTINKQNIEIENQIRENTTEKNSLNESLEKLSTAKKDKDTEDERLLTTFQNTCWSKAKVIRDQFAETIIGNKTKALFASELLAIKSPKEHNKVALQTLYETAFDPNAQSYKTFLNISTDTLNGIELLGKPIISSSDTPFATFIQALNATDWVRQGHDRFPTTPDSKCPYCQQVLPSDFEDQVVACFDAGYQNDIETLLKFKEDYVKKANEIWGILKANTVDRYPKLDLVEYVDKCNVFESTTKINLQKIDGKIKEPTSTIELEDVANILDEINVLIDKLNLQIQGNNDIVNAKQQKQAECRTQVWEYMAYTLQSELDNYKSNKKNINTSLSSLTKEIAAHRKDVITLTREMTHLNKQVVNTTAAIDGINKLLTNSGFQGFSIREKACTPNSYEVIRRDGSIAHSLSEGECNFIAFLYFYHLVRGSDSDSEVTKDKIVVIDDPVSSMDSGALFIVSSLVREMIEVCHNNIDYEGDQVLSNYIKQIFILTHNAYFHNAITYDQVHRYKPVSFYLIEKQNNVSTTRLCVDQNPDTPAYKMNFNPVQNAYAALWSEYREVTSSTAILNVIRRILEHYFLQLCGYDGQDLIKRVLKDNRDKFICQITDDRPDCSQYHLATAMLSYLGAHSNHISDGLNYVEDCTDIDQYRATFKMVFELMDQSQHYNMMMGTKGSRQGCA